MLSISIIPVTTKKRLLKLMYRDMFFIYQQGCLEGEEREKWWNEMKEVLSLTEQEIKEKESWSNPSK